MLSVARGLCIIYRLVLCISFCYFVRYPIPLSGDLQAVQTTSRINSMLKSANTETMLAMLDPAPEMAPGVLDTMVHIYDCISCIDGMSSIFHPPG